MIGDSLMNWLATITIEPLAIVTWPTLTSLHVSVLFSKYSYGISGLKVIISISLRPRSPFIISQMILKIKVLIKDEYYFWKLVWLYNHKNCNRDEWENMLIKKKCFWWKKGIAKFIVKRKTERKGDGKQNGHT